MHGRPDPKHLLDTLADQNIGNGFVLQPQAGGATVIPQNSANSASYERILVLTGPSSTGQTTSVVLTASRIVGPNNPYPGFPGPITGIIEFGNGGQTTRAEVDIPVGPFIGSFKNALPATEPQDSGVIITVPTSVLRVYARYDNNLIQAPINKPLLQSLAQSAVPPVAFVGPGGPVAIVGPPPLISFIPPEPVQVKAMAAFFSRHTSKVYRTHYLYVGAFSGLIDIPLPLNYFCIPPFARALKVFRYPNTIPLVIDLCDNMNHVMEVIDIPAPPGLSPLISIEGTETIVGVQTKNPTDKVSFLALCYEIGI